MKENTSWKFRILWRSLTETYITRCSKWNEMNRALGHLCAHIGQTGPGEPPEDGEMIEMTLSSRHRIRNSSPGGLRPSTLPLGHGGSPQYWLSHVDGEETGNRTPNAWKAAVLTTTLPVAVLGSILDVRIWRLGTLDFKDQSRSPHWKC